MVLAVKAFAAFRTYVTLLARMNDVVQGQLLLAFERLRADGACVRTVGIVALLVPRQVILPLQPGAADIAKEPPLDGVAHQMLLQ